FDWLQRIAVSLKIQPQVREELQQAWENGSGPKGAGIALLALNLSQPASAEPILNRLLERGDLTMTELDRLIGLLEPTGQGEWLAKVQQRAAELIATDDDRLLGWIRTLHKTYGAKRAKAEFDRWSPRFWLNDDSATAAGEIYA